MSKQARRSDEAQDLLEYAILVGLIAIVAYNGVKYFGDVANGVFWEYIAGVGI